MDPNEGKVTATLVLSIALGLAVVLLSGAVLVGVIKGSTGLTETGVRILSTALVAVAGVLGFEQGRKSSGDQ